MPSRISTRKPVLPQTRRKLTRVEFAQLMLEQEGRCLACREKLRAELIVDEHLTPLAHGGSNDLSNRALYCTSCARTKTEDDIADIVHGRRVRGEIGQQHRRRMRRLKPWTAATDFSHEPGWPAQAANEWSGGEKAAATAQVEGGQAV